MPTTTEKEERVKINDAGRLVIPAHMRKALGILAGHEVILRLENDELRVITPEHRLAEVQKLVRRHLPAGSSLSAELIEERRLEAASD